MDTFPKIRRQVKAWLKSDVCDFVKRERTPTEAGTPQGGVISPLLANIALHGMEEKIKEYAIVYMGLMRYISLLTAGIELMHGVINQGSMLNLSPQMNS